MKAKSITDLQDLKRRTLKFFKELAQENGWKYDLEAVDSWNPWKYQRSFYTKIILSYGKKGFFKCPVSSSARKDFLRELTYLSYIGKKHPGISVQIYDYSNEKGNYWMVTEFLSSNDGGFLGGEGRDPYTKKDVGLILDGLRRVRVFESRPSVSLIEHTNYDLEKNNWNFYIEKLLLRMESVEKFGEKAPNYPFNAIKSFLSNLKTDFSKCSHEFGIIHGDVGPNNIFIDRKNNQVIFLDWEKAFLTRYVSLYSAFDFANFYFRCWRNLEFQSDLLQEYVARKDCSLDELKISCILQNLRQMRYLVDPSYDAHEEDYLKNHIRRLIESLEAVLKL